MFYAMLIFNLFERILSIKFPCPLQTMKMLYTLISWLADWFNTDPMFIFCVPGLNIHKYLFNEESDPLQATMPELMFDLVPPVL